MEPTPGRIESTKCLASPRLALAKSKVTTHTYNTRVFGDDGLVFIEDMVGGERGKKIWIESLSYVCVDRLYDRAASDQSQVAREIENMNFYHEKLASIVVGASSRAAGRS